jgi:hypothetical protein
MRDFRTLSPLFVSNGWRAACLDDGSRLVLWDPAEAFLVVVVSSVVDRLSETGHADGSSLRRAIARGDGGLSLRRGGR